MVETDLNLDPSFMGQFMGALDGGLDCYEQ